jgi:hypothetical protein
MSGENPIIIQFCSALVVADVISVLPNCVTHVIILMGLLFVSIGELYHLSSMIHRVVTVIKVLKGVFQRVKYDIR